jgi:ribosomal-protein-alanine N-acetyltransferase
MTETVIRIPSLRTDRLVLRAPRPEDFEAYAAFRASERARVLGGPFTRIQSFEQLAGIVGHWQLRGFGRWIVADRATGEALGIVGLFYPEGWPEPEIAWSVFEAAEGRGIAFEAATAARDYAYRVLGWSTVVSLIAPDNHRSVALALRLGAAPDGVYPHAVHGDLDIYRHPAPKAA